MPQGAMADSVLDRLRVYKQVCQKICTSLVAGREEVVSPTTVSRSFLDSLEQLAPATSTDSGIFAGDGVSVVGERGGCPFVEPADGWSIEYSEKRCERCGGGLCTCHPPLPQLELRPMAEAAYRQHFYGHDHLNFYTEEPDIGPCLLSIKTEGEEGQYRVLVRSSDHYLHGLLPSSLLPNSLPSPLPPTSHRDTHKVVAAIAKVMKLSTAFKPAEFPDIQQELLRIDETFVKSQHKFGVLCVRQDQRTEEEIFSNSLEAGPFDEFLKVLGKRVELQGFGGFLGGLDSDRNLTGRESVFTEFSGLEVMFHVAPLMPFSASDPQQVNKKRHIGNDIVCLVFLENGHTVFNPSWVRSNFIHCCVVVQHVVGAHGQPLYKVAVTSRHTVPNFPPELRHVGLFAHSRTLQHFLLTKAINGERAAYHAPKFLKLTNRSRGQLLHEFMASLVEHRMASKQGRSSRKLPRRSAWLPIGASRPPSPLMDSVREKYSNSERLADDFQVAFRGCELADVVFLVGEDRVPVYAVKAILACRSRVFRMLFKEGDASKVVTPLGRRRLLTNSSSQPQFVISSPQNSRKPKMPGLARKKKVSVPDLHLNSSSVEPGPFQDDPHCHLIKEQYVLDGFSELVFTEVLNYLMTGSCSVEPMTVVGLACAAEKFEVEELKQACFERLSECLSVKSICIVLSHLEKYLSYASSKAMIVQCLQFVDSHASEILVSDGFLDLSENMVHLVLRRDSSQTDVPEILKVRAIFAWGERKSKPGGPEFKSLVTGLVRHVRLHLIDPQDIMKTLVPSGVFDMDKLMAALAYQVDPQSVEVDDYTMFRPRKKSSVLSSR